MKIPSLDELLKQSSIVKENFEKAQNELRNSKVTGESGAGMVKITMNCAHEALSVSIDDALFQQEKIILEELITSAINDTSKKIKEHTQLAMNNLSSIMDLKK